MNEWLSGAVLGILGAALISAAARALAGDGRPGGAVRLVCGALVAFSILRPFVSFDWSFYAMELAQSREAAAAAADGGVETARRLQKDVIEAECASYICDRAGRLGADVRATVVTDWGGSFWVPVSCTVSGLLTESQRRQLSDYIAAELGIPEDSQCWETE